MVITSWFLRWALTVVSTIEGRRPKKDNTLENYSWKIVTRKLDEQKKTNQQHINILYKPFSELMKLIIISVYIISVLIIEF